MSPLYYTSQNIWALWPKQAGNPCAKRGLVLCLLTQGDFTLFIYIMLTKQKKAKTIKETAVHATDTGSPEVQVALLSKKIDELTSHLKKHLKDKHSRRGLLQMVADRRTHLKYLESKDKKRYSALVKKLGLKK